MTTFLIIYGVGALAAFMLFFCPMFPDWGDYTWDERRQNAGFAAAVGLLWPLVAALFVTMKCCRAYFTWKEKKRKATPCL